MIAVCTFVLSSVAFAAKSPRKARAKERSATVSASVKKTSAPSLLSKLRPVVGLSSFSFAHNGKDQIGGPEGVKAEQGLAAGAFIEFGERKVSFQTGLLYFQAGAAVKDEIGVTAQITAHYLAVPLYAKWSLVRLPKSTFFLKAGVVPAYFLGGRSEIENTQFGNFSSDLNRSSIHEFDVLTSAGAGASFPLGTKSTLLLDLTFNRGLVDFSKSDRFESYNQGLLATASASFPL